MKTLSLLLISFSLFSCASKKLVKTDWTANTGKIVYNNYENTENQDFLKDVQKYIHCEQAYKDISEEAYDELVGEGTFQYQCLTHQKSCREGNGQSCFLLGLEELDKGPEKARDYFTKSCDEHNQKGCYFAGMFAASTQEKSTYYDAACTLGHKKSCDELELIGEPLTVNEQLAYVEEYVKAADTRSTASGLAYKIINQGKGKRPQLGDKVVVHYEGRLITGEVFDSSYQRGEPAEFALGQVIRGWTEGLQLMKEGGKIQLVIPAQLAYGSRGAGDKIPGGSTLVFDVELISVK